MQPQAGKDATAHNAIGIGNNGFICTILPQVKRPDLAILAKLLLLLAPVLQTHEVERLAWEDPFILGRDAQQLKQEREQSPDETQKRLAYALPMIELMHEAMRHG